jgi:hypothetical protein
MIPDEHVSTDRRFTDMALQSRLVALVTTPVRHVRTAWRHSVTAASADSASRQLKALPRHERVRLLATAAGVAMLVHVALVLTGPRPVEPLTLLVPAVVTFLAVGVFVAATAIARVWERTA